MRDGLMTFFEAADEFLAEVDDHQVEGADAEILDRPQFPNGANVLRFLNVRREVGEIFTQGWHKDGGDGIRTSFSNIASCFEDPEAIRNLYGPEVLPIEIPDEATVSAAAHEAVRWSIGDARHKTGPIADIMQRDFAVFEHARL
jgi:hypothetical protein